MYCVSGSGLSSIVAAYVDEGLTHEECITTASVIGKAIELRHSKLTGIAYSFILAYRKLFNFFSF